VSKNMTKDNKITQHEAVAVRKGIKSRTYSALSALHKQAQNEDLFNGFAKEFQPVDEEQEETYPPESKRVQLVGEDVLATIARNRTEFYDIEATQEFGNQHTNADVVVDGQVLIKAAPATLLMALEKDLKDLITFVSKMPTLDEAQDWEKDPNSKLFRTKEIVTHKTSKVQRPVVLQPPTKEHPAQTQLITKDVVVGYWHKVNKSGALPVPRKEEVLERLNKLRDAVKQALSRANKAEVDRQEIGGAIFSYLLG
jgi:hypothetical protein